MPAQLGAPVSSAVSLLCRGLLLILQTFPVRENFFFCSRGGCFSYSNLFPFPEKVFWSLPTLKTLSKAFKKSHRPFPAIKNLSKTSPKLFKTFSRPLKISPKPLQDLSELPKSGWALGPLPSLFWASPFCGFCLGFWASSGFFGPLPSLFWASGPLWALC